MYVRKAIHHSVPSTVTITTSAIIYAITQAWSNGVGGETCTDKQRAWGKGAAQVMSHDMISDMVFDISSPFDLQPSTDRSKEKTSTHSHTTVS